LENWAKKQAQFNLEMAKKLPELMVEDVIVTKISDKEYEVALTWRNVGGLPVALEQAKLVKIVQEDRVTLVFDKELTKGYEEAKVKIENPALYDKTIYAGYTGLGETKSVKFIVRVEVDEQVKGKIKLSSTRGGLFEQEFVLNN